MSKNFMSKHSLDCSAINYEPINRSPLKMAFSMKRGNNLPVEDKSLRTTPILKKKLPKGINAEANNDGTISVNKNIKGKTLTTAVNHEKVHLKQMKRGDLNYDDNYVFWKGKKYPRSKMKEGDPNLPWEKEAYNKQNKKQ